MKIHTYISLPIEVKAQIELIHRESFSWKLKLTPQERIVHEDKFCSDEDRIGYVVIQEKRDIIGVVTLLRRPIIYNGISIMLGGIGALCTRKDKRKRGVGTVLLRRAMDELRRNNCDIAYLCTDVSKDWMVRFYEKEGFVRIKNGHRYTGTSGKRYTDTDGMIAPVCSKEKFQRIIMSKKVLDIGRGNW